VAHVFNQIARLLSFHIDLRVRWRRLLNLLVFDRIDELPVPDSHVYIAIQVTAGHHVLERTRALRWKHDNIV